MEDKVKSLITKQLYDTYNKFGINCNETISNSIKSIENNEEKNAMHKSMKDSLKRNIQGFNKKTLREEKKESEQEKQYKQFTDIFTFEQFKQIEEWCNLSMSEIVFDSNNETWDIIGNEGSHFQENIISKNNLFFYNGQMTLILQSSTSKSVKWV